MNTTNVPDPHQTLNKVIPATNLIYSGLEFGAEKARTYFDQDGSTIDPYLASMLTRFQARKSIKAAAEALGLELDLDSIPNIGLRLRFADFYLWIVKAIDGELAPPGWSETKQIFYNQLLLPFPNFAPYTGNLVVLWDATKTYYLKSLSLICPKSADLTTKSLETHWEIPIPHPADFVTPQNSVEQADASNVDPLDEIQILPEQNAEGNDDEE